MALALLLACNASQPNASPSPEPSQAPTGGGTVRVVVPGAPQAGVDASTGLRDQPESFLDPQLDGYGQDSFSGAREIARCCLARTLLSYNGLSVEDGGARLQPDLAATMPDVSADGLTWTFHLKPGLHWGPPLQDVEITAQDFIRAIERLYSPDYTGWYAPLSASLVGGDEFQAGTAANIAGLESPDAHTLVIHLSRPGGDLAAEFAAGWTAPIPPNPFDPSASLGIAAGAEGGMGKFLVSSGPYMLEGSAALDFAAPAHERPAAAGISPGKVILVRNPSWDPATDLLRPAYADRIEIYFVDSIAQAVADLDAGKADLVWPMYGPSPSLPADIFAALQANPARGSAHLNRTGLIRTAVMNLAVPPFDDIHVRKALNLVVDKQALVELQGGPVAEAVFAHIVADSGEDGLLLSYDPYPSQDHRGDIDKGRAEMAQSKYDTNGDGLCDAPECSHITAATRAPYGPLADALAASARSIGLELDVEDLGQDFVMTTSDPTARLPLAIGLGYSGFFISGASFLGGFDSAAAFGTWPGTDPPVEYANTNMVGATPEQLQRWGYTVTDVPNVDDRVAACYPLIGQAQAQCWASVDQYLMEYVVPWLPYSVDQYAALTSPRVISYAFNELTSTTSLDHLALAP